MLEKSVLKEELSALRMDFLKTVKIRNIFSELFKATSRERRQDRVLLHLLYVIHPNRIARNIEQVELNELIFANTWRILHGGTK